MQFLIKKGTRFFFSYLVIVVTMLSFSSCYNDNSDQIVQKTTAIKQFEFEDLIKELSLSNTNLKETVIGVEGVIADINFLNKRNTIILREKTNADVFVICDMQENQASLLENLELGKEIKIKGILKGSLKDIILLNCIINN